MCEQPFDVYQESTTEEEITMSNPEEPDDRDAECEKLLARIENHFPDLDLDQHPRMWTTVEGRPALIIGEVLFRLAGDDLHAVGPSGDGRIVCRIVHRDGTFEDEEQADPVAAAADVQLDKIAERLADEGERRWGLDPRTGELVAMITVGELTYHEIYGELIVQREAHGGFEWTVLGDDDEPVEPWRRAAPPAGHAEAN